MNIFLPLFYKTKMCKNDYLIIKCVVNNDLLTSMQKKTIIEYSDKM